MKDMFHGCFYLSSVSEPKNGQYICKSYDNYTKTHSLSYEETKIEDINKENNININYELKEKYKEESIDNIMDIIYHHLITKISIKNHH